MSKRNPLQVLGHARTDENWGKLFDDCNAKLNSDSILGERPLVFVVLNFLIR